MKGPDVLRACGLVKSYRGRRVVDNVDLSVNPGEVVALLGPNGAGKTTTFKMILGLVQPDSGSVAFGSPLDHLPLHRRAHMGLGYLPQGGSIFRGLTVRSNLLAILEVLKVPQPKVRAQELIEQYRLRELADQRADTLSGGERRRLEFARALCSEPRILLCDEPFAGVDPLVATDIADSMRELAGAGVGVLLTDHSVRDAIEACDRVMVLAEGRVVEECTASELLTSETARRHYLGDRFR